MHFVTVKVGGETATENASQAISVVNVWGAPTTLEDEMTKSSKTPLPPPKGDLEICDGELVIRTASGDYLLADIAKAGADGSNAELRLVITLSKRSLGRSDARAGIRSIASKLETFLGERALNAIAASATCSHVPVNQKAPPPKTPKAPKALKGTKAGKL